MKLLKKWILICVGFACLGLGAVGVFLPILPTTPFVLVALFCFSTTPKMKAWVLGIPFFREYAENYEQRTGLAKKTVYISLSWLWGMLILSMVLVQSMWMTLGLVLIGSGVSWHILWIARRRPKGQ